jgi:hypothetical protein
MNAAIAKTIVMSTTGRVAGTSMSTGLATRRHLLERETPSSEISISLVDSLYKDAPTFVAGTILVTGPAFIVILEDERYPSPQLRFGDGFGRLRTRPFDVCVFPHALDGHDLRNRPTVGASLSSRSDSLPRPTWNLVLRRVLAVVGPLCLFLQLFDDDHLRGRNFRTKLCKPPLRICADLLRVGADGDRTPPLRKSLSLDFCRLSHGVFCGGKIYSG